jgi:hypothetical protein
MKNLFTTNYDAWKTQGPEDDDTMMTTTIELSVNIDFLHDNPDSPDDCAKQAQEAITQALVNNLGLQFSDIEVGIELAKQECHEA